MKHDHILQVPRLAGLCDGVFAIAMTILIVEVRLPSGITQAQLSKVLTMQVLGEVFIYAGSFIILGTQWIAINFQHGFLHRVNRYYLWANIFFLMTIGIIPFSAHLLINFPDNLTSIVFYSLNLTCCSVFQLVVWQTGELFKIYSSEYNNFTKKVIFYRLALPPVFYVLAVIIAQWHTMIAFIILMIPPIFYLIPGKLDRYISKEE